MPLGRKSISLGSLSFKTNNQSFHIFFGNEIEILSTAHFVVYFQESKGSMKPRRQIHCSVLHNSEIGQVQVLSENT